jgi:hypothetical protein
VTQPPSFSTRLKTCLVARPEVAPMMHGGPPLEAQVGLAPLGTVPQPRAPQRTPVREGICEGGEAPLAELKASYPSSQPRRDRGRCGVANSGAWTSQGRSGRAWSARNGRSESSGGVTAG